MSKVIVFGTGQIAEVAYFYLKEDSQHQVVAFTVDRSYFKEENFKGIPVIPFDDIENFYSPQEYKMFVPISYRDVNKSRAKKYYEAKKKGYSLITYISSKAIYYNTPIGENCFILENNIIQPYTKIGNNVVIWSGNHIGHHSTIMDHCFLASHIVVSGNVTIEPYCFIGVNATLRDNIKVARENVIGAGAIILKSTEEKSVYASKNTPVLNTKSDQLRGMK